MKIVVMLFICVLLYSHIILAPMVRFGIAATGWNQTYGEAAQAGHISVTQTIDGGYALAATNSSQGSNAAWLIKTDSAGNIQWSTTYNVTGAIVAFSLVQTSDRGYALAGTDHMIPLLIKTDSAGNIQWYEEYQETGTDDLCSLISLVYTSDRGYAVAATVSPYYFALAASLLIKTDSDGNMQWYKVYGGTQADNANTVASVVQTSDGGFALAGSTDSQGSGFLDSWLVKTDSDGNMQWNKVYGGSGDEEAKSVVQTTDGGYAMAGYTLTYGIWNMGAWLVKTDSAGNLEWNQTYGGAGYNTASSVVQTSDGGYALAGTETSSGAFGVSDAWLAKTDSAGNLEWNQTYGGAGYNSASMIIQTNDEGYAMVGTMSGGYLWLIKTDGSGLIPEFPSMMLLFALAWGPVVLVIFKSARAFLRRNVCCKTRQTKRVQSVLQETRGMWRDKNNIRNMLTGNANLARRSDSICSRNSLITGQS